MSKTMNTEIKNNIVEIKSSISEIKNMLDVMNKKLVT